MPIQDFRLEYRKSVASVCSVNLSDNIVQVLSLSVCIAIIEVVEYLCVPVPDRADEAVKSVTALVLVCLHPISIQLFCIFFRFSELIDVSERFFEIIQRFELRICFKEYIKLF